VRERARARAQERERERERAKGRARAAAASRAEPGPQWCEWRARSLSSSLPFLPAPPPQDRSQLPAQ